MTRDQEAWLKKAEERLGATKICFKEGYYETTSAFAYYVMFYVVTALMLEENKKFKSHAALISAFHTSWIKTGKIDKEFHRYLTNGFDERNNADYDLGFDEDETAAALQIERAEAFLKLGREILGGE